VECTGLDTCSSCRRIAKQAVHSNVAFGSCCVAQVFIHNLEESPSRSCGNLKRIAVGIGNCVHGGMLVRIGWVCTGCVCAVGRGFGWSFGWAMQHLICALRGFFLFLFFFGLAPTDGVGEVHPCTRWVLPQAPYHSGGPCHRHSRRGPLLFRRTCPLYPSRVGLDGDRRDVGLGSGCVWDCACDSLLRQRASCVVVAGCLRCRCGHRCGSVHVHCWWENHIPVALLPSMGPVRGTPHFFFFVFSCAPPPHSPPPPPLHSALSLNVLAPLSVI
jgi:hypothetical protein